MNMYNTMWAGVPTELRLAVQPGNRAAALADGAARRNRRRAGFPARLASITCTVRAPRLRWPCCTAGPAYPMEQCPGLGLTGDLMLVDLSQYIAATKGTIQTAMSIHLKFDYDESVFRWIYRMDGPEHGARR